jgi:hypothetical protein
MDNRDIICACGNIQCKIGLSFDTEPGEGSELLYLYDKYDNEALMYLNIASIDKLNEYLKEARARLVNFEKLKTKKA